jgi:hypothetical protein
MKDKSEREEVATKYVVVERGGERESLISLSTLRPPQRLGE